MIEELLSRMQWAGYTIYFALSITCLLLVCLNHWLNCLKRATAHWWKNRLKILLIITILGLLTTLLLLHMSLTEYLTCLDQLSSSLFIPKNHGPCKIISITYPSKFTFAITQFSTTPPKAFFPRNVVLTTK